MQNWTGSGYGGFVYDAPEEIRDYSVKGKYRIPMNMHIGNMGLAPAVGAAVTTGPPLRTGGNIDNKRIGIGGMSLICLLGKMHKGKVHRRAEVCLAPDLLQQPVHRLVSTGCCASSLKLNTGLHER